MDKQGEITLKGKLTNIGKVFDIKKILALDPDKFYIQKYYKINQLGYTLFHTSKDLIHMGISRDGVYKEEDLFEAPKIVEKYIVDTKATRVLELATGRGANSVYLAERNSGVIFNGIDISEGQLCYARKKAKKIKNYKPSFGDYHDLSIFQDASFDVVFVIEALCHSKKKEVVLAEVHRVLKPNGVFIVIDGYRERENELFSQDERIAVELTEKTMAVNFFDYYKEFKNKIISSKFIIEKEEDVSEFVLPTMNRFEKSANSFFRSIFLAKLVAFLLPKEFVYNAIAGYLMPTLVKDNVFSYRIFILRKI